MLNKFFNKLTLFFLTLFILLLTGLPAQVVIKDTVEITPLIKYKLPLKPKDFSSNYDRPVLLRMGGYLIINGGEQINEIPDLGENPDPFKLFHNGERVLSSIANSEQIIGPCSQWSSHAFWITYPEQWVVSEPPPEKLFPILSAGIFGGPDPVMNWGYLWFNFRDQDDWFWHFEFWLELHPDSSLAAMPPSFLYEYDPFSFPSNPYQYSGDRTLTVPNATTYRLTILSAKSGSHDQIKLIDPIDSVLVEDASVSVGASIDLGYLQQGYQFTPAIISHVAPIVEGMTMFPSAREIAAGKWDLYFEDWTDLDFGDIIVRIEPAADVPEALHVVVAGDTLWHGDTIAIDIIPQDAQGRFSPLETWLPLKYSIELLEESQRYGYLLFNGEAVTSVQEMDATGGIGKGVSFVATGEEPFEKPSVKFYLKAFTEEEIIGASISKIDSTIKFSHKNTLRKANSSKPITPPKVNIGGGGGLVVLMENEAVVPLDKKEQLCPVVSIVPSKIKAGETAEVIVKGMKQDGTLVDYPEGTQFTFTITNGADYGTIVGTTSPAQFVAKEEINFPEGSHGEVNVTIHVDVGGGANTLMKGKENAATMNLPSCPAPEGNVIVKEKCDPPFLSNYDVEFKIQQIPNSNIRTSDIENALDRDAPAITHVINRKDPYNAESNIKIDAFFDPARDCYVFKIVSAGLEIEYGIVPENASQYFVIDDLNTVTEMNACDVHKSLTDRMNSLRTDIEKRGKKSDGTPRLDAYYGPYILYDGLWDHEKSHRDDYKEQFENFVQKAQSMLMSTQPCMSKDEICDIVSDQIKLQRKKVEIENEILNSFDRWKTLYKSGGEKKADLAEAEKYKKSAEYIKEKYKFLPCSSF